MNATQNGSWARTRPDWGRARTGLRTRGLVTGPRARGVDLRPILARLPERVRAHVLKALDDREARPFVLQALRRPDPMEGLQELAKRDVVNTLRDRPRVVVFKALMRRVERNVDRAMDRIVAALPDRGNPRGRAAHDLAFRTANPRENLAAYYARLAADELDPDLRSATLAGMGEPPDGFETEMVAMAGLSRYVDKIGDWFERAWDKGYLKVAAGAAAVGALSATGVLDDIWGGIKSAVSFVGGGVSKLVGGIFGGGSGEPTPESEQAGGEIPDQTMLMQQEDDKKAQGALTQQDKTRLGSLLKSAVQLAVVSPEQSKQAQRSAYNVLLKLGMGQQETTKLLAQLMAKAVQTWKPKQPEEGQRWQGDPQSIPVTGPTPEMVGRGAPAKDGIIPGVPNTVLLLGGAAVLILSQRGS